jgi:hypothetical protein
VGCTNLHDELGLALDDVVKDVEIDDGAQVVYVRYKKVLFPTGKEPVDETRVGDCIKQVTVAGRIPKPLV